MNKILKLFLLITMFFGTLGFASADTSYIYYYGNGCPHCAKVDEYMQSVNAYEGGVINIEKREVWKDVENAKMMSDDIERLGIDQTTVGVPFLIINEDGNETTLGGDTPIIDYFKTILGEPAPKSNTNKIIGIIIILLIGGGVGFFAIKGSK